MIAVQAANTTARKGNAQRSRAWMKLYPAKATRISTRTTIPRARAKPGTGSRTAAQKVSSAKAPLTLLTATQPAPAVRTCSPAGSRLPKKPKPARLSTIWATPRRGPMTESRPWKRDPRAVPRRSATAVGQKPPPKRTTGRTPT
jgi:hypothetical protein